MLWPVAGAKQVARWGWGCAVGLGMEWTGRDENEEDTLDAFGSRTSKDVCRDSRVERALACASRCARVETHIASRT